MSASLRPSYAPVKPLFNFVPVEQPAELRSGLNPEPLLPALLQAGGGLGGREFRSGKELTGLVALLADRSEPGQRLSQQRLPRIVRVVNLPARAAPAAVTVVVFLR